MTSYKKVIIAQKLDSDSTRLYAQMMGKAVVIENNTQ